MASVASTSSECSWSLVAPPVLLLGPVVRLYSYENHDNGQTGTVWVSPDLRISYQSQWEVSPWHGSFEEDDHADRLLLKFHYEGNEQKMKSAVAIKTGDGVWDGFDGNFRRITIRYKTNMRWCLSCKAWHEKVQPSFHGARH